MIETIIICGTVFLITTTAMGLRFAKQMMVNDALPEVKEEKWMKLPRLDLYGEQTQCPFCKAERHGKPAFTGNSLYDNGKSSFDSATTMSVDGSCSAAPSSGYCINTEDGSFLYQACVRCRAEWLGNTELDSPKE